VLHRALRVRWGFSPPGSADASIAGSGRRGERNFIDVREKDRLVGELRDSFTTSLAGYVSHPQFAVRFLLREYRRRLDLRSRLRGVEPSQ